MDLLGSQSGASPGAAFRKCSAPALGVDSVASPQVAQHSGASAHVPLLTPHKSTV